MAAPSGSEETKRSEQYTQKTEQQCEPIVRSTSINLRFSGILAIVENAHLLTSVIRRWVGAERVDKFMVMPFVVLEHSLFRLRGAHQDGDRISNSMERSG